MDDAAQSTYHLVLIIVRLSPFIFENRLLCAVQDGTYELYHPFELNLYLDTIIKPVMQYGGSRKIVFSCFHPDICSMYSIMLTMLQNELNLFLIGCDFYFLKVALKAE